MVSVAETQTLSAHLQRYVVEKENGKNLGLNEHCQKMVNQKSIVAVQICLRCGRKLPLKKGRKSCPYCQGLLRTRTIILKVTQF